ncbi:hypothetical protein A9Q84_17905 [Halobacteriovorax marinus]|uniref:Thioesterase n=1 Tax=Halobacteriovorax marinus TaxID=97084 RepID=A0A1Y5F8R3_9BACT|nr:hypothetical protein A9Q84_17905 [Halobacteriovorax marinus]
MNLYLRFIFQSILAMFSSKLDINDVDKRSMRVMPLDLDANFHMNNGVFLSIMDLGRTRLSFRTGLYTQCKKRGWGFGVVGGISITYLKSLAPFQRFTLCTKLAGHYDGWFYIEQRFVSKKKLVACALVKVAFLEGGKRVPTEEIVAAMGVSNIGENMQYLEHLYKSEKEFLNHVKNDY